MLSRIGDKWSVLVVSYLGPGPMRFNELKKGSAASARRC
ncbi:winged helix-turn-helix transcriptional regulator [Seohaeicola zhoushanensis]